MNPDQLEEVVQLQQKRQDLFEKAQKEALESDVSMTPAFIWDVLSKIDCSKHIEKKGNLTYLSWAWAYGIMMRNYPEMQFYIADDEVQQDGTILVNVIVTIGDMTRKMWLPVMDNRNKPVANPNAFQINTTRMRCLTKCFALFGLGHYIYAGEDLPPSDEAEPEADSDADCAITEDQYDEINQLIEESGADSDKFCQFLGVEDIGDIQQKDFKAACDALIDKYRANIKAKIKAGKTDESE